MRNPNLTGTVVTQPVNPAPIAAPINTNGSTIPAALANFDSLPDSAHVRLPTVAAWRSISSATVWRHVKCGLIPKPVKLGPNITAWNVGSLRAMAQQAAV